MRDSLPRSSDLGALAEDLAARGEKPRLVHIIRQAVNAYSCLVDLRLAADFTSALVDIRTGFRGAGTDRRAIIETALLTSAVSAYARATITQSQHGDRGGFDIRDQLDAEQLSDHQLLVDVRNQVLAHVYPGREVSGSIWHEVALAAVENADGGWFPALISNRLNRDDAAMSRLQRMLPIATGIIQAAAQKRVTKAMEMLRHETSPKELGRYFLDYPFDPIRFTGSLEAAVTAFGGGYEPGETRKGFF